MRLNVHLNPSTYSNEQYELQQATDINIIIREMSVTNCHIQYIQNMFLCFSQRLFVIRKVNFG